MIYRTITVTAELTDRIIEVTPELLDNIIEVAPELSDNIIEAEAQFYTWFRTGSYDDYVGAYEVTPLATMEQVLDTSNKHMTDDVTVYKVPYFETTNEHGTTVYIAEA